MEARRLSQLALKEAADLISRGEVSAAELVEAVFRRIEAVNPKINAYITLLKSEALEAAREADREIREGKPRGPLHGIPFAVKDVIETKGVRTTAGSKILADHVPDREATVVSRLKGAGAILVGKHNTHEFAYGATNEESHFGPCRNPWNPELISGGSSGGSGAAVAAGLCYGALGTDTGGSARIPASFCGVVGLKPTYGRVSRFGVIPVSWSLDHVCPITRTVEDAAIVLEAISGRDPKDPTTAERRVPRYAEALGGGIEGVRAAVLTRYMEECVDPEVREAVEAAVGVLEGRGVEVEELSIPNLEHTAIVTNILMACEATRYHEEWLATRATDYTPSVRTRLQVGYFYLATHYLKALQLREWFRREFARALKRVDVILSPTCPISPFKIGQPTIDVGGRQQDPRPFLAQFTRIHDLTGFPAVTVPCGFTREGVPVGFQVAGRPFDEETVLRVAYAYEQSQPWKDRRPQL